MTIVDPVTREPLGPIPGERPRPPNQAAHWLIVRDENGMPIRMEWDFCDDPTCCPELDL